MIFFDQKRHPRKFSAHCTAGPFLLASVSADNLLCRHIKADLRHMPARWIGQRPHHWLATWLTQPSHSAAQISSMFFSPVLMQPQKVANFWSNTLSKILYEFPQFQPNACFIAVRLLRLRARCAARGRPVVTACCRGAPQQQHEGPRAGEVLIRVQCK